MYSNPGVYWISGPPLFLFASFDILILFKFSNIWAGMYTCAAFKSLQASDVPVSSHYWRWVGIYGKSWIAHSCFRSPRRIPKCVQYQTYPKHGIIGVFKNLPDGNPKRSTIPRLTGDFPKYQYLGCYWYFESWRRLDVRAPGSLTIWSFDNVDMFERFGMALQECTPAQTSNISDVSTIPVLPLLFSSKSRCCYRVWKRTPA